MSAGGTRGGWGLGRGPCACPLACARTHEVRGDWALSRDGAGPHPARGARSGRGAASWGNRMVLSLTLFREEIFGVGTSFQRVRFIISYPLGTFFSSSRKRKTINPDALEAP